MIVPLNDHLQFKTTLKDLNSTCFLLVLDILPYPWEISASVYSIHYNMFHEYSF